jgi:hypothetical protein
VKDNELGWIVVDDRPDMTLECRDETAWALLLMEMCQASVDKGWNRATPASFTWAADITMIPTQCYRYASRRLGQR